MRAIKIDPIINKITFCDIDEKDTLQSLYESIGCDLVEVVRFNKFDLWIDEEGLYNQENSFRICDNGSIRVFKIMGPAVLLCSNDEGDTLPLIDDVTLDYVENIVWFENEAKNVTDEES